MKENRDYERINKKIEKDIKIMKEINKKIENIEIENKEIENLEIKDIDLISQELKENFYLRNEKNKDYLKDIQELKEKIDINNNINISLMKLNDIIYILNKIKYNQRLNLNYIKSNLNNQLLYFIKNYDLENKDISYILYDKYLNNLLYNYLKKREIKEYSKDLKIDKKEILFIIEMIKNKEYLEKISKSKKEISIDDIKLDIKDIDID